MRTLHHDDAVGLVVPSERTHAGYRLYTDADLTRLACVVTYRRLDRALEREMEQRPATTEDLKELFGDGFSEEYRAESQERWGETDAWQQSAGRTKTYTPADWVEIKAEADAVNAALVAALEAGLPASSTEAMDAAEAHRAQIERWFYDLDHGFHRGLADMYVADPRFTRTYEDLAPGLARYVHDAVHANADRHEQA